MLKCTNVALEILLEFGMRYSCQFLAIDKCRLLIRFYFIFLRIQIIGYEFFYCFYLVVYYILYTLYYI
jgi:hypothetical protein